MKGSQHRTCDKGDCREVQEDGVDGFLAVETVASIGGKHSFVDQILHSAMRGIASCVANTVIAVRALPKTELLGNDFFAVS